MSKSNRNYWHKRSVEIATHDYNRIHRDITKALKKSYENAIVDIQNDIHKLYNTFSMDNNMSYEESQELLTNAEKRVWKKSIKAYQDEINRERDAHRRNALELELNIMSMQSRITRLEALEAEIKLSISKLAREEEQRLTTGMKEIYEETYYKWMHEAFSSGNQKAIDMSINHLVALDDKAVMKALSLPWSGSNYSERIWHRSYNVANKVSGAITKHLQSGKDVRELIAEISDELKQVSKYNIERLVQTELTFARSQADLQMYEDLEVEEYRYLATLDGRTSKECQDLDGKTFKVMRAIPGVNYPPMHAWCRSTTIPDFEGAGGRSARDKDGKSYRVDRNLSYKDWKEKYVDAKEVVRKEFKKKS